MRRLARRAGQSAAIAVLALLLAVPSVAAAEYLTGGTVLVDGGETISGDMYAGAQSVVVNGRVLGDVVAAAQNVVINGHVTGSVNVTAQSLTVDGQVGGAVRAAASEVAIAGAVGRDVVVFANSVHIAEPGRVRGDVRGAVAELDVDGTVDGAIIAGSDRISVDGRVTGGLSVEVDELRIGPSAEVGGDVRYTSSSEGDVSPLAEIAGVVQYTQPMSQGAFLPDHPLVEFAGLAVALVLVGFFVILVRPIPAVALGETLRLQPFAALGVGLATWVAQFLALIVLVLLAFLVGQLADAFAGAVFFVAVVLTLVLVLLALLAQVVVTLGVARVLASVAPRRIPSSEWLAYAAAAVLVAAVVTVAGLHPISAGLVWLSVWIVGLGTIVLYEARRRFVETHPLPVGPGPSRRAPAHEPRTVATGGPARQTASGSRYSP